MVVLYGISNCDSVKKARAWLVSQSVEYIFHDFKKIPPTKTEIETWLKDIPLDVLLNKRGTTWRKLSSIEQAQATDPIGAVTLMVKYNSLIKRPILEYHGKIYCGFDANAYQHIIQG